MSENEVLDNWIDEDNEEVVVDEETEMFVQPEDADGEVKEDPVDDSVIEPETSEPEEEQVESPVQTEGIVIEEGESPLTDALTSAEIPGPSPRMVPIHVVADLREKNRQKEQEIASLQERLQQTQPSGERDAVAETLDDDDFVTVAELNRREAVRQQQAQAESQKQEAQSFAVRATQTETEAKAALTAEKCGEGLDYDSVTSLGKANLSPGDLMEVRRSANPAKEFYRRCLVNTPTLLHRYAQTQKPATVKEEPAPETKVTQENILSQDDFFDSMFPDSG